MKRDGNNISLWQELPAYNPTTTNLKTSGYHVVIVGGGMTGVTTALLLQLSGVECLLVESHNLGFGTTGGTTAHLNTLLDTPYTTINKNFSENASRIVASAAAEAINTIENNIKKFNIECEFERTKAYLFSQEEKESKELIDIYEACKEAGLQVGLSNDIHIPVAFEKSIVVEGQAKFHPMKYLFALAKEFEKLGGHIQTDCRVESVKQVDDELLITTSGGVISAKNIVYATHIPPGVNILHLRCAPWRSYAMALKLKTNNYPRTLLYDMKDPYHYYRSQVIDGENFLIVGGKDHKTGHTKNTYEPFLRLRAHVEGIFQVEKVTHQWSSQYFESADGLPYIGVLPGHTGNYFVATGFGGNGMIYSHVAAKEITNLIVSGKSAFDDLFSPGRIKPIAGFSNFISHNADVVKQFVGSKLAFQQLDELADLAPGEGKVVSIEDQSVAIAKDINGKIHAVSPVCTHLKCNVEWNGTEHSWDCPCHGARYSLDGKVLTGPASHDLERVEWIKLVETHSE